jgi:PKD repeat protein
VYKIKNKNTKKHIVTILIVIFFISILSSSGFSGVVRKKILDENNFINSDKQVTFIQKSTGLNIPEKEGGGTELELADINNDGHLDIICVGDHGSPYVNSDQHGIMVWLNDGEGSWSVIQVGNFGYGGIEAGDLNLDGYLDVVWGIHHDWGEPGFGDTLIGAALGDGTASNWIGWAEGLGTGGEDWGMFSTDLADFDCNGLLDIISMSFGCCNGYHCYENHGDGTWSHKWSLTDGNVYKNLEVGDFNADGYPDFVGTRVGTYVFIGDGAFDFTMNQDGLSGGNYYGIDCGDMNNDGCDDIVFGLGSSGVKCYKFDKQDNEWISASDGLPGSGEYQPQFGDIDGDGHLDIIAYSAPTGTVYLGDGNGNWESDASFTMPSPGYYSAFVVDGDFDHDGREDVVIQGEQGDWPSYQNVLKAFSPWEEPDALTAILSSPHGGETFRSGSIRNIRWLSAVPTSEGDSSVEIQVSTDGISGPWRTIASNYPNNGCYQWLVDAGGSENCRIKIIAKTSSETATDISDSDFTIIGYIVDSNGPYLGFVDDPIQFTGSAENGAVPYDFHWDFGDSKTSTEQNPIHAYNTEGNFTVILTVKDDDDLIIRDSTWANILEDNNPPSKPVIDGPLEGKPGTEYEYFFVSNDIDNDELSYSIDWGDGIEEVIGTFPSGVLANASHIWTQNGSFTIRAQAEDSHGARSEWGTLTINIPRCKIRNNEAFIAFVNRLIRISEIFKILLHLE